MIRSRLTSRHRTTIPQSVRETLGLRVGDEIAYVIAGNRVVITKAKPNSTANPFATFHEWASEADDKAYGDL